MAPRADQLTMSDLARPPLIIAHRGASGYRPEHTLAGYELAARLGADFIEPDLVSTRDGVLVARHEPEIGKTTDVATRPEFANRWSTKHIDGQVVQGWFVEDFTLAELRTLRAVERLPATRGGNTRFDGQFRIPTLDEVISLAVRLSAELGRTIGIYPETKNPSYHASIGLPLEPTLVRTLREAGLDRPDAPVFVQSFEAANLRELAGCLQVPLVQLADIGPPSGDGAPPGMPGDLDSWLSAARLRGTAEYATVLAPRKQMVVSEDGVPTALLDNAHEAGLRVHPYTFRNENRFLPATLRSGTNPDQPGNARAELERFLRLGVDGVFTDHPDTAVFVRAELHTELAAA